MAHSWQTIRLGRVCERCGLVQANGEFDDTVPCEPDARDAERRARVRGWPDDGGRAPADAPGPHDVPGEEAGPRG